ANQFGIELANIFPMWDWVGGRYSLWSAVGLPIALTIGMDNFNALLAGAHAMDCHFRDAPADQNLPVVMAMLSIWNNNLWGAGRHPVLPYDDYPTHLPEHLPRHATESKGSQVAPQGTAVDYRSGTVIWGAWAPTVSPRIISFYPREPG